MQSKFTLFLFLSAMSIYKAHALPNFLGRYNLILSKLITLLQSHVIELISFNNWHEPADSRNQLMSQKNLDQYKFLLERMKNFEDEKSIQPQFSQCCQPLLDTIQTIDSRIRNFTSNHKSLSLHSNKQKLDSSKRPFSRQKFSSQIPSIQQNRYLGKTYQFKNSSFHQNNQVFRKNTHDMSRKSSKRHQSAFESYQNSSQDFIEMFDVGLSGFHSHGRCTDPCPGKWEQIQEAQTLGTKRKAMQSKSAFQTLHTNKNFSKKSQKNNSLNRRMINYPQLTQYPMRFVNRSKTDGYGENQPEKLITQKEIFSFQILETPNGTISCTQDQIKILPKLATLYKKSIDRTYLKRNQQQYS